MAVRLVHRSLCSLWRRKQDYQSVGWSGRGIDDGYIRDDQGRYDRDNESGIILMNLCEEEVGSWNSGELCVIQGTSPAKTPSSIAAYGAKSTPINKSGGVQ